MTMISKHTALTGGMAALMISVAAGSPAQSADKSIDGRINDQVKSFSASTPDHTLGVTYSYADRSGREKETTDDGLALNYTRKLAGGQKEFWILSGGRSDFDTPVPFSKANSIAGSFSYGRMMPIADGLQLTLGGLLSTTHSDIAEASNLDLNSQTAGAIVGLRQSFPIASNLFGAVRATALPRFTHKQQQTGNNFDSIDYTITPGADLYYMVNKDLFLGTGLEATLSNKDVTLSRRNHLYRGGVGAMYKVDHNYSALVDYKRELMTGHHGDIFSVTITRSF